MASGIVTTVHLSNGRGTRFAFVSCQGKGDLRFTEADLVGVEMDKALRGRSVVYNEQGNRAERVRLAD